MYVCMCIYRYTFTSYITGQDRLAHILRYLDKEEDVVVSWPSDG